MWVSVMYDIFFGRRCKVGLFPRRNDVEGFKYLEKWILRYLRLWIVDWEKLLYILRSQLDETLEIL